MHEQVRCPERLGWISKFKHKHHSPSPEHIDMANMMFLKVIFYGFYESRESRSQPSKSTQTDPQQPNHISSKVSRAIGTASRLKKQPDAVGRSSFITISNQTCEMRMDSECLHLSHHRNVLAPCHLKFLTLFPALLFFGFLAPLSVSYPKGAD